METKRARMRQRDPNSPALYLDYDGVLHPDEVYRVGGQIVLAMDGFRLFEWSAILEELVSPYPKLQIVLATSWVRVVGFDEAYSRLPPSLQRRVVGSAWYPHVRRRWEYLTRYEQIQHDIERHRHQRWLAIYDDATGWPEGQRDKLVLTDSLLGLGSALAQDDLREKLALLYEERLQGESEKMGWPVKAVEDFQGPVGRRQADARLTCVRRNDVETDDVAESGNVSSLEILESELLTRGRQEQRLLLDSAEMLSLCKAAEVVGVSARTFCRMRAAERILALALPGRTRVFRYPSWQFEPIIFNVLPDIIRAFGSDRMWQVYDFLTYPEPLLGGRVPLDVLRLGRWVAVRRILPAAAGLAQGGY